LYSYFKTQDNLLYWLTFKLGFVSMILRPDITNKQ